jgi:hypothetical protein
MPGDRPPGQSLYSAQGFGYQRTPTPVLLPGFGSRMGITPAPAPLPNQTITTLSHARGEAVSPSPELSSDAELAAIRPKRWPLVLGLVGVATVATALFFAFRPGRAPGPAPVAVKPAPAPASIRLEIRSTPMGATVFNTGDGTVLGMTPLDRAYPQGQGTMNVLLRLHGYKDRTVSVRLDGSSATGVDLERIEVAAPVPAPKPTVTPASPKKPGARKPPQTKQNREEEWLVH